MGNTVSRATRRNIIDALGIERLPWHGDLAETDFLSRIYDLNQMPSFDPRHPDAEGDITRHRLWNDDWPDNWVFGDQRFSLLTGSDEAFLRFLCEMVHPLVRRDSAEVEHVVELLNGYLAADGWEIAECARVSGKPIFTATRRLGCQLAVEAARTVAKVISAEYVAQQITRMEAALDGDPGLAIGTAKEFVETVCKTILEELGQTYEQGEKLPRLVRQTLKELKLVPSDIPDEAKAAETIRRLLSNLATISDGLAELRNPYGTGHGKSARSKGLQARHARLAVGAAVAMGVFLFETYLEGREREGLETG